jgi:hypothetical protein
MSISEPSYDCPRDRTILRCRFSVSCVEKVDNVVASFVRTVLRYEPRTITASVIYVYECEYGDWFCVDQPSR